MIQCQLKLRPCKRQQQTCDQWLIHLASVYNFAVRKIELNAANRIYFRPHEFTNLLAGHSKRLEIPSHTIQGVLRVAYESWARCFDGSTRKPRLKGVRNKMASIPFPDSIQSPKGTRILVPGLGWLRFHKMDIPDGKIKSARLVKRASGWHLCLFIDGHSLPIEREGSGSIGIDPGFKSLLATSDGELINHPRELEASSKRLAQAQRGRNRRLVGRVQERTANRKKDRNHKLSHRLVSENVLIAWSKDNHVGIAKKFGKSVSSSAHSQLRQMIAYKSPKSGTQFVEVASKNSTRTCSSCGALTGPTGWSGLSVRQWRCPCGAEHDRDVNAARNTLLAVAGYAIEGSYLIVRNPRTWEYQAQQTIDMPKETR